MEAVWRGVFHSKFGSPKGSPRVAFYGKGLSRPKVHLFEVMIESLWRTATRMLAEAEVGVRRELARSSAHGLRILGFIRYFRICRYNEED